MSFAIRLRSVRPKDGSAELRVVKRGADGVTAEISASLRAATQQAAAWSDLKGAIVIWWDQHGAYRCHIVQAEVGNPIPATLMPSYVHDVILRELIEAKADKKFVHSTPPHTP